MSDCCRVEEVHGASAPSFSTYLEQRRTFMCSKRARHVLGVRTQVCCMSDRPSFCYASLAISALFVRFQQLDRQQVLNSMSRKQRKLLYFALCREGFYDRRQRLTCTLGQTLLPPKPQCFSLCCAFRSLKIRLCFFTQVSLLSEISFV